MQIDSLTARVVACMCLVLLSIAAGVTAGVAFYEMVVDWEGISSLFLGFYLYSAYLLTGITMNKPKGRLLNHRHQMSQSSS